MKKLILFCVIVSIVNIFPQALTVTGKSNQSQTFNLSDISSISFKKDLVESIGTNPELAAATALHIYSENKVTEFFVWHVDSIYLSEDGTLAYFETSTGLKEYNVSSIDSIIFSTMLDPKVYVTFTETSAQIVNPYKELGVNVSVQGNDVIVTSTSSVSDINYVLSGSTTDGMFKIYSSIKFNLVLNGVSITNNDGPAINVQSSKKITVTLPQGSTNILTDGVNYITIPNEDQKAAFFSEGQLIFTGTGSLLINGQGVDKHGLSSDDYIEILSGSITIASAKKDGINVNDNFIMRGGTVNITAEGDGIDGGEGIAEFHNGSITVLTSVEGRDAIKSISDINITGGNFNLTVNGNRGKAINSEQSINITGGTFVINTSGNAVLQASGAGFDPSYCSGMKATSDINIENANITITTSGMAGRGLSTDKDINIKSGAVSITSTGNGNTYTNTLGVTDAYTGPCINSNGRLNIFAGNITLNHSGKGGKGISVDGKVSFGTSTTSPEINIATTGQAVVITTNNTVEAKAISADSAINIYNGIITISSTDDGIKSDDSITIHNGTIKINQAFEAIEAPFITINGGDITAFSSDDCLNATKGGDLTSNDGSKLNINGGRIVVSATTGDAIDSNGDFYMNGGIVIAHGPQSSPEVGIDVNGVFRVTGGFMVVSGTNSNMTQSPATSSTQRALLMRTTTQITAGTLFHLEDANGNNLLTFAPTRRYYSMIFSSPQLAQGIQYKIYTGGTSTGTPQNGLYNDGTYSGGTLRSTFTLNSIVQTVTF